MNSGWADFDTSPEFSCKGGDVIEVKAMKLEEKTGLEYCWIRTSFIIQKYFPLFSQDTHSNSHYLDSIYIVAEYGGYF